MPASKKLTKEQIEELYIKQNLSKKETAKALCVSEATLTNYFRKFGISKSYDDIVRCREKTSMDKYGVSNPMQRTDVDHSSDRKIELDKDILYDMYVVKNMSTPDISKILGVSASVIQRRMKEYGVKRERVSGELILEEELKEYYINQNHTIVECSQHFNMSTGGIKWYINKYNMHKDEGSRLERIESTMQERYGVSHALQNNDFLAKRMNTYWNRTEEQNKASMELRKKTNLDKYGVEHVTQSDFVKQKTIETNQRKFGVSYPTQNKEFRKKIEENMLSKYGAKNPSQVVEFQKKREDTINKKYGVTNFGETALPLEVREILNSKKKLVEFINSCKSKTTFDIAKEIGCSFTTLNIRINRYKIRNLIDQCSSHYETEIASFLDSLNIKHYKSKDVIKPLEIDFYCPDYKIGIEFDGDYWHSSLHKEKKYHYNKSIAASKKGIRIIHIWEHEWNDSRKRPIIESMLKIAFGKIGNKIYARNCEVREITDEDAKSFNNANHLQGHRRAQITYGLFYNDELVQLMSFSQTKYNRNLKNNGSWEIIRGCPGSNNIVVGGVSKLFKYFLQEKNPNEVFSYCDFNKFDGRGYEALGMKFDGYTGPDLKWLMDDGKVVPRNPARHKELQRKSVARIWGCGSKKYLWVK